jgi:hypothetical protein
MAWSLDWFAASALARQGKFIRRVGWTNRWLIYHRGLWWIRLTSETHVVRVSEFGRDEFLARDWTDEAFSANPCGALPAYHMSAPSYRDWGTPIMEPPPIPGVPES